MKIKELHPDIERYLLHDCYCPHEVYSFDGFGYQLFYEDQECEKLGEAHLEDTDCVACIANPFNEEGKEPQIVVFWLEDNKCYDALRYDATENNIEMTKIFLEKGITYLKSTGKKFDEFRPGSTAKSLKQILSIADAIMID